MEIDRNDIQLIFKIFLVSLAVIAGFHYWINKDYDIRSYIKLAYENKLSMLPDAFTGPSYKWAEDYSESSNTSYGHFDIAPVAHMPIIMKAVTLDDDNTPKTRPWQSASNLVAMGSKTVEELRLTTIDNDGNEEVVKYRYPIIFTMEPLGLQENGEMKATISGFSRRRPDDDNTFAYEPFHQTVFLTQKDMSVILHEMEGGQKFFINEKRIDGDKVPPFLRSYPPA